APRSAGAAAGRSKPATAAPRCASSAASVRPAIDPPTTPTRSSSLDMPADSKRRYVNLYPGCAKGAGVAERANVSEVVDAAAERDPSRVAVLTPVGSVTYGELAQD